MSKSTARPSKIFPREGFAAAEKPADPTTTKPKRNGTSAGKRWMARIAQLPCLLCELIGVPSSGKVDVHHVRDGAGAGQRNSDWLTIPLCHDQCHQGPQGLHGDKSRLRLAAVTELDLLAMTIQRDRKSVV